MRVMRAEEAFKQGEMALRRDQLAAGDRRVRATAVELQPDETEYQALLAWAQFAAAPDKNAVATTTRKALHACGRGQRALADRALLPRSRRAHARPRDARRSRSSRKCCSIQPNHAEAASEARILEQRLKHRR